MGKKPYSRRSPQTVKDLESDFLRRNEFYEDPARLVGSVLGQHRDGGGRLMEGWLADSIQVHGFPGLTYFWSGVNSVAGYAATANGGPYYTMPGNHYFNIADSGWNEFGANTFFVWRWVYLTATTGTNQAILAKYQGIANYSWMLFYNNATFSFLTNPTGLAPASVGINSTYAEQYGKFYFVGAFMHPSTRMAIYVGAADDDDLTIDSLAVGVPASVFNGGAHLMMGGAGLPGAPAYFLNGRMGIGNSRLGVPAANIDSYARRLFHADRWFYQ